MKISATIRNAGYQQTASVDTAGVTKTLSIPAKSEGHGSSVNGGELLFLALATCFCNDTYREAAKRNMEVSSVEVTVSGQFGAEGQPASGITYDVHVIAPKHSDEEIRNLVRFVDGVAEIHNTLRVGIDVKLVSRDALPLA